MKLSFFIAFLFIVECTAGIYAQQRPQAARLGVGIALEYDTSASYTVEVGTELLFDLRARDDAGAIITDWDQSGEDVYLRIAGSKAETDSSTRSWNDDPAAYSWLNVSIGGIALTRDSISLSPQGPRLHYTIRKSVFNNGAASLTFTQTAATRWDSVLLSITPQWSNLTQESPPIRFTPGPLDNYIIDLTTITQGPDTVFYLRPYEFVVGQRDRYLNYLSTVTDKVKVSARFPEEFYSNPGGSDVFTGFIYIRGVTNFWVTSLVSRSKERGDSLQWLRVQSVNDSTIYGQTSPYEILDHPPNPFSLLTPPDWTELELRNASEVMNFTWEKAEPQDPYTNIHISRFDPRTFSDVVYYSIRFVDAATLTRVQKFEADDGGKAAHFSMTHAELSDVMNVISGVPGSRRQDVIWWVEATDTLYVTGSTEPAPWRPGFVLQLRRQYDDAAPVLDGQGFTLAQNYPNPFKPSTEISYSIPGSGHVQLVVYDLLGKEIKRLVDTYRSAGGHRAQFNAAGLPSGIYLYRLTWDDQSVSRRMTLTR